MMAFVYTRDAAPYWISTTDANKVGFFARYPMTSFWKI